MDDNTEDRLRLGRLLYEEVLAPMKSAFVGKDEIVDVMGICLVGGENLFLLGPPGTAKSALVHDLARRIEGKVFDYLLTRFTEPNELFGPFDIRKLRDGELVTNTEGMLPEAALIFLDELLNANSAILNSLLLVLNERIFRRGRETRHLPALMVVGASNRLPEDEALGALFDRFLLRVRCDGVAADRLADVLDAGWRLDMARQRPAQRNPTFHVDDIRRLQTLLPEADLRPVRATYCEVAQRIRQAGISLSDRRAVKLQRLVAASAILCGRLEAKISDLWILRYIWDVDDQREILAGIVQETLDRAKADDEPDAHPRSLGAIPDPESLARDLETIEQGLVNDGAAADVARLRDRLSLISSRCQWIVSDQQRAFLDQQMQKLWKKLDDAKGVAP